MLREKALLIGARPVTRPHSTSRRRALDGNTQGPEDDPVPICTRKSASPGIHSTVDPMSQSSVHIFRQWVNVFRGIAWFLLIFSSYIGRMTRGSGTLSAFSSNFRTRTGRSWRRSCHTSQGTFSRKTPSHSSPSGLSSSGHRPILRLQRMSSGWNRRNWDTHITSVNGDGGGHGIPRLHFLRRT